MSRDHHYRIELSWSGADQGSTTSYLSYSRDFVVEVAGKPPLVGSADSLFRGDPGLLNPEDLMVAALASCHMLTYLADCARSGVAVLSYSDTAIGIMVFEGGGGKFVSVALRPKVVIDSGSDLVQALELHRDAHANCFIARSVNFPVTNQPEIIRRDLDDPTIPPQP